MALLINLSMYLSYLFEGYIAYMYFSTVFECRQKLVLTRTVSYIMGFSFLFVVFLIENSALNMVCSVLVMMILGVVVFKAGWLKSLFHSAVVSVMLVASETLVIALFNILFNVNAASIKTPPIVVIVSIASKILLFAGCKIISLFSVKDKTVGIWTPMLFIVPVASMLCLLVIYYQSARLRLSLFENVLNCLVSVFLMGANFLVFYVYERSLRNEQELSQLRLSEQRRELDYDYYKMLEENRKESRVIIHDIKHHLSLIRCMAQECGNTDIAEYIASIQNESYFCKSAVLSGNKIMDAILSQKILVCEKKGIEFSFEHNNTDLSFVGDWDLCAIVSNTLDNAIESAVNSGEKNIQVRIYRSENGCFYFFEVINSCDEAPAKNTKGFVSTKKGRYHGIGLYSIKQAAEKYSGQMKAEYTGDKKFRTTIMLQSPQN